MRRWIVLLFVALVAMPSAVTAQQATPEATPTGHDRVLGMTLSAEDLGDGWRNRFADDDVVQDIGVFRTYRSFFGPEGSRLSISVYELPALRSEQAGLWASLQSTWQSFVDDWSDSGSSAGAPSIAAPLPEGVNDGMRFAGYEPNWGASAAVGVYALDSGPIVWMLLEGNVHDQTGIPAIDDIIKLIVAKAGA